MPAATDNISVANRAMKQEAVYWPPDTLDEFGRPSWGTPEEISCRWEDVTEEFIDPNGDRQISKSKLIVDRDLLIKGLLKLGELDSTVDQDDPKDNEDVWEIRLFSKIPDFKGRKYLREVYL